MESPGQVDNHQEKITKQKSVHFRDQPIIHSEDIDEFDESPPTYDEVCPQFIPQSLSPILDEDTNSVIVLETNLHTQRVILSPPVPSPCLQRQSQTEPKQSIWIGGILLIVISSLAVIVALPCGIIALAWSLSAYFESNPVRRRRAVIVTIAMNIFIVVAMISVVLVFILAFSNGMK